MASHSSTQEKEQFLAFASRVMRQVLIDYARRRRTQKRGDFQHRVTLDESLVTETPTIDLLILDEALSDLESMDARQARIAEMRIFAGLTVDEIAAVLNLSSRTVKRDWVMARAWLQLRLRHSSP
jgi:RNA polymerase sigma factor (TIGR02999 family)